MADLTSNRPLEGHRIVITGAARGLGEAFARAALAAGARVVITDVLTDRGHAAAQAMGSHAHFVEMDVASRASVNAGMQEAVHWLGGLDGVVNNAAVTNSGGRLMAEISEDMWDSVMAVNVKGPWLVAQAAHAALKVSGRGRIVNLSSDTALWGAPKLMAYIASKGAVAAMTRGMARELGADLITVNAIAPGLVVSESTEYVPQARHDFYAAGRAIERAQLPQDVTAAVVFLLSEASGFITGQVLPVNGGFVMH
jgi:NAD(P)-dependent dehydrogenase (short-subunit alcohol dehydrogenase family)